MRADLRDVDPPAEWLELLGSAWQMWARDDQLPPEPEDPASPWRVWVILGGRGAGKTRAGAEWIRAMALGEVPFAAAPVGRIALVGETLGDVRRVMIEGVSGLMAVHADSERPHFEASKLQLTWPNGTVAQMFSAENPDSLRGPQFACAWCDELAKWRLPETAWDMLQFGLRLGEHPQVAVTTTPRPIPLLRQLVGDAATVVTRASTIDNEKNLSPGFVAEMTRRYAGTALGRQELMGEIIEDMTGALWRREWIAGNRVRNLPDLARIVVAVDPPVTATESSDACGIVVAGLTEAGDGYVIADRTLQGREPHAWARAVVATYHEFLADRVVAEVNQGGDLVVTVLRQIDATVAVRKVHATRGKWLRAEPIAALYAAWKNGSLDATSTPALLRELKAIPDATVRAIYSERYWRKSSAYRLPAPLALMHFDSAVNHGPGTAIRILQQVVGVDVDGEIGPVTLAAVAAAPMIATLERYAVNRRERYRAMPHFWRFGRGWLARVDRTLALSAKIAAENPSARNSTGRETMTDIVEQKGKWWGNSLTIWGAITTGLTAIVPVLGPLIGIDVSGDAARDLGTQSVAAAQGLLALIGTVMTIFGRARATQPIERRVMNVRL